MVDVLVSDLGNVLLKFDDRGPKEKIARACTTPDAHGGIDALFRQSRFARGAISPETFYAQLVECLGLRMPFPEFCDAYSDMFLEDADMLALVKDARVDVRVLLSNTNAIHWQWILRHHAPVLASFDFVVVSHLAQLEKPEPEIFAHVAQLTGRALSQHVFIDDIAAYTAAATRAGMQAITHVDATTTRAALVRLGVLSAH